MKNEIYAKDNEVAKKYLRIKRPINDINDQNYNKKYLKLDKNNLDDYIINNQINIIKDDIIDS